LKKKILIISALLVPESWEKSEEELEDDIRRGLSPKDIPWCEKIEKVRVLSEG
jgi:hypothetical protein